MSNLKNAIGTLADVVSEEIEHLRKVVINGDIEQKIMQTNMKLDQLASYMSSWENEKSKQTFDFEALIDEMATLKAIEGKKFDVLEQSMIEKLN